METLLELRDVTKTFRRGDKSQTVAVKSASLSLRTHETVALVGESGSGKSTLARLALCLIPPDSGDILYRGESILGRRSGQLREFRSAVQPIFQDPTSAFNPRRNVRASLYQVLKQAGVHKSDLQQEALRLLDQVYLKPATRYLDRFPHQLSGGQRQRLGVARALGMSPKIIVADEPLSGADASIRGQLLNLMTSLQAKLGVGYLLITHDIALAAAFADRVAVMCKGEIVEEGPSDSVLQDPQDRYTRSLVALAADLQLPVSELVIQRREVRVQRSDSAL